MWKRRCCSTIMTSALVCGEWLVSLPGETASGTRLIETNIVFLGIIHRPEVGTSSIHWAQLSRFYLKTETESSLRNVVLKYKQDGVFK
jgi:hypothetical protein